MTRTMLVKWIIPFATGLIFFALAPRTVTPQLPLYLGITSCAILIRAFDLLPVVAVAAALTFIYLLTHMAPPEVVFGPWTTILIWTTFGAAIFGEAMEKTVLAKRVALRCILLCGGSFAGMLMGLFIGSIVVGLLLASGFARTVIFCAIAVGVVKALDIDPKSRLSSIIILAFFFAAAASTMEFLHTSESFIWSFKVLMEAIGFVAGEVGANKWMVSTIIPVLESLSPTMCVIFSCLAGVLTNLLLTPFAATVAFTPAFAEPGTQLGVNPLPLFYAFEYDLDQYFLPYEGVMFLYMFTTGCVTLKHILPIVFARFIVAGVFIAVVAIPFWKFVNIMYGSKTMKKLAILFLTAGMLLTARPGHAIDFKIHGQFWMGFTTWESNFVEKTRDGKNARQRTGSRDKFQALQRVRLQLEAIASETLSGTVQFQIGNQRRGKASEG